MDSSKYTTWTYGPNDQLLQVRSAFSTNVISQYDSTYDSAGRRVAIIRSGLAMSETRADEYNYNIRGELISAIKNTKGTKVLEYQYQYDDIGNRISSHDLGTNRTYTANNLNQYTSISNSASSALSAGEFIPQFDDDGNQTLIQTATGIWQVQYNGENRPIFWVQGTNTIAMSYDRMVRRVTKNDQRFVYDGYLQIANFEEAVTNSQLTTYNSQLFIWDPTELVATRPLVWNSDNCTSVYTHDGNKNVSEVIKSTGIADAHYEYTPFGAVAKQYGDCVAVNPWRFSSEYGDGKTGTMYYNYRHYCVSIGRWMCPDPIEELACASGNPKLCLWGSRIAGFIGSVANELCTSGLSLTDGCSWFSAMMTGSVGCVNGANEAKELKEELVFFCFRWRCGVVVEFMW